MQKYFLIIGLGLFLTACKTRKAEPFGRVVRLEDKKWYLTSLNNSELPEKDSSQLFTLEIFSEDNAVYFNCNCDTTYGLYTAQDEFILLTVLGRTDAQCNPSLFDEYIRQAKNANRFQIKNIKVEDKKAEQLILWKDDQELMRFNHLLSK